ncbi:hypothetical protein GO755_04310 [Spirosoma sp. HMF4905]|uniref:SD-repeat containing protein B domain-containing protein n=1 Tax=Spirosoma arboris TaxID=2682092 RepID=A0A7K1S675_9BACT|nr:SdrD B-like domain-containing protein [Spirosoma arboris]MVM29245.1 hypothetical protein [Spirosoma arboris]
MKQVYLSVTDLFRKWLATFLVILACITTANAQVKGVVFRDFDLNGIRSDTLPIEVGVAGVTVRAFVDLSKTPISTTTAADGTYAFSSTDAPAGKTIRIEFDGFPRGDYNGPYGAGSGTSVQFVKAPIDNANLGINYPADYCQPSGVNIATPNYVNGNTQITTDKDGNPVPVDKQAAAATALISFSYIASGVASASDFLPNQLATAQQIGSVWSLAYQRRTKKLFSGAVVKRHMSFGPLGTGGLYITDITTGTTTNFIDLRTLGIDTGDDPHSGLFGDKTQASVDPGPMVAMGRISIGGMDISEDDKTLYFVNLKDRKLYGIFVDAPARTPTAADVKSWEIPDPGCSNGDFRPWAVKVHHGKIYVGVICSAETSQQQSDLKATVYRFDPTEPTPNFEEILSFPLDFRRGPADGTFDPLNPDKSCLKYDHWLPWTEAWPETCGLGVNPTFVMFPQPILSDFAFDDDGSMMIGFLDRFGHLSGLANHDPQGNGLYNGFTGGDLLRAYNNNGTFVLESNGQAGDRTGSGVGNNEGPGGGEFYGKDEWFFIDHIAHFEITNGALVAIPGYNEIITSAFDPITNVFQSAGMKVFSNKNGQENRNYVIYTQQVGSFGKAAGLGDTKALCDPAPVQIGNRVWFDDNRDGIQDAYEPGIDGIVLTLHDMENGGVQIGTQTTHDGGQFYFNNTTVPAGLLYNHKYEIRMDTTQLPKLDITLSGAVPLSASGGRVAARGARKAASGLQRYYTLSPANRSDFTTPDLRDSNAQLVGGSAVIAVTSLEPGQNDFTNDLSIYSCPELVSEKDTIGVCAGTAVDSIAATGKYFSRVDSVRFVVFSSPQSGTAMYGNTGTLLGTVKPNASNRVVLYNPAINTVNNSAVASSQYVYAIIYPMPENPACRQSSVVIIRVTPALSVTATGGKLTCSVKEVTLTGQAIYGDGSIAPIATYAWTGPGGFTSSLQNPIVSVEGAYILTIGNPSCPSAFTTTTAVVTSDTVVPELSAFGAGLECSTCSATLYAEAPGATLLWTGPNGFTSTEIEPVVTIPGEYTVTATGVNGCKISTTAELLPSDHDDPCANHTPICVPITIKRIK